MAEFCKECFLKINPIDERYVILSEEDDCDWCENCCQLKPYVISTKEVLCEEV